MCKPLYDTCYGVETGNMLIAEVVAKKIQDCEIWGPLTVYLPDGSTSIKVHRSEMDRIVDLFWMLDGVRTQAFLRDLKTKVGGYFVHPTEVEIRSHRIREATLANARI